MTGDAGTPLPSVGWLAAVHSVSCPACGVQPARRCGKEPHVARVERARADGLLPPPSAAAACRAGQHYGRRDRDAPPGEQWACVECGAPMPEQPGVGALPDDTRSAEWVAQLLAGVSAGMRGPAGTRTPLPPPDLGSGGHGFRGRKL